VLFFGPYVLTSWMFVCKVVNGATYVQIDMMESKKDGTRMLLIEGARKPSHLAWATWHAFMN
jgi:hypothetical protein